jgi:hypothetical protein
METMAGAKSITVTLTSDSQEASLVRSFIYEKYFSCFTRSFNKWMNEFKLDRSNINYTLSIEPYFKN